MTNSAHRAGPRVGVLLGIRLVLLAGDGSGSGEHELGLARGSCQGGVGSDECVFSVGTQWNGQDRVSVTGQNRQGDGNAVG